MPQALDGDPIPVADQVLVFLGKDSQGNILVDVTVRMDDGSEVKGARLVPEAEIMEPGKTMKANLTVDIE
jgi:hypothetical protein